jgi:hypothetical protein
MGIRLEVGKFYLLLNGKKVRIDAILPEDHPGKRAIGLLYHAGCPPQRHGWNIDGSSGAGDCCIVSEWTEPKVARRGETYVSQYEGPSGNLYKKGDILRVSEHYVGALLWSSAFKISWEEVL